MNNNFFFQPKVNGNVSFRHNSLRTNNENLLLNKNVNKSLVGDEGLREFGKDLTNLTNLTALQNGENVNPNLGTRKLTEIINKENKVVLTKRASFNTKDDLTGKFKNYIFRKGHSKTVNEVLNNTKKEAALKNLTTNVEMNNIQSQIRDDYATQNYSSHIINNDIMEECFEQVKYRTNIENINPNDMMTDDNVTMDQAGKIYTQPIDEMIAEVTPQVISEIIPQVVPEVIYNPNPQLCEEYMSDIHEHLKDIEFDHLPSPNYMKQQTDINEKMRGILIDWLVEVHLKFKLLPETLFLAVNLIDRFLEIKQIMRNRLQLVGVTAMLIACKYEEIYAPEVRDFVYITDKAYTKEEILQMENDMLATLDYNITVPSPMKFLEIYSYYVKFDEISFIFCRYLLELFLIEYKMLKFNPSLLASSTVYIAMKIMKKGDCERISQLSLYNEEKLRECAKEICVILDNVEKASLQAVRKKFSLPKYLEVAKIKFN